MAAELAVFALIIALMLSLLQGASLFNARVQPLLQVSSGVSALLILLAFSVLITLRMDSDFTVANVAEHSNYALPLLYKIAGTWGNHEGSMLLWACIISGYGAVLAISSPHKEAVAIQALLTAGVLIFILATSNPFARIFPPPVDGQMLNPLLQDIALSLHPPLLYLGYVGFSSVFSLAIAALLSGKLDRQWAESAHPWIMFAWSSLTLGIALGSWWAYRELGWGGFWFWDPVENASLLPWLAGTALLHSNMVLKKCGTLAGWVALLSILTFSLSLLGTFLVRSGAITSVHSFASDPTRGLYILCYMAVAVGGGLWVYGTRIHRLAASPPMTPVSREGAIVLNNLFMITACATVLLGTLYPMMVELLTGAHMSVGAPYFNRVFLPIMATPLVVAALVAYLPWKKAEMRMVIRRAWPAWGLATATTIVVLVSVGKQALLASSGLILAAFLMGGSAQWLAGGKWKKAAHWPVFLGHVGAALVVIGITGAGLWSTQTERLVAVGDRFSFAGYEVVYAADSNSNEPNYTAHRATLKVLQRGAEVTQLFPEYRRYIRGTATSEAAIYSTPAYDFYSVIGETGNDGKTSLRLYYKPTISFLWLGAVVITVGGLLSAFVVSRRKA